MNTQLLFGIHCHQPVENFYSVVDDAIFKCYKPFLEVSSKYKNFKFNVHFSGWLLDYIRLHHNDVFMLLKKLVENNQIEFFSGGFYEPILTAIPSKDRISQIKKMNDYIYKHFGQKPHGLWLTERVWDPSIIPDLVHCDIDYITVDDYHFLSVGYNKEDLFNYYITEQDGYQLKVFPIDKHLRYIIPFKEVSEIINYLTSLEKTDDKVAVIFDDGEKFGVWPGTYDWVYNKGWLSNFLENLLSEKKIESNHFSKITDTYKPKGIAYLPITSYMEMGEWSLFANSYELFDECLNHLKNQGLLDRYQYIIKGGIWKNFLSKYSESNHIHKRILDLSKRIEELDENDPIKDALLKAECNDVFWHGIFGGLYLPNLRNNAYRFIIEADKLFNKKMNIRYPSIDIYDINYDGYNEAILKSEDLSAIFTSKFNGQLIELDILQENFNLQNTLTRRKEGYHKHILEAGDNNSKKDGITTIHEMSLDVSNEAKENIIYDWYIRNSFVDHFSNDFNLLEFSKMNFNELGDFANKDARLTADERSISFEKIGGIFINNQRYKTIMKKNFLLEKNMLNAYIDIDTELSDRLLYILEFNFHFYHICNTIINDVSTKEASQLTERKFKISDGVLNKCVYIEFNKEVTMYWYIVKTVSQSEKGVDLTDQCICLLVPFSFTRKLNDNIKVYIEDLHV
jgi:alpha-amylase/alpha-mannosidase (GH57 family)